MSIRELAVSDAQLAAGGFIYRWDDNGFGDTIYINIQGPPIAPEPFWCGLFSPISDWIGNYGPTEDWVPLAYDIDGMYVTGFSMNDSYGGEPSI